MHHPASSAWRSPGALPVQPPPATLACLLDQASLTRRLQHACGEFRVELLRQAWCRPRLDERRLLGLSHQAACQVREVVLWCGDTPVVFARSILPAACLTGRGRVLRQLRNRSLGDWLFDDPRLRRSAFELALVEPRSGLVPTALQADQALWGRRSRFETRGQRLLVCEFFLPGFRPYPIVGGKLKRNR